MNVKNETSNINFTSDIRFVSKSALRKLAKPADTITIEEMWHVKQVQPVQNKGATNCIAYCVAGVIKNLESKKDYIFHWFPTNIIRKDGYPTIAGNDIKNTLQGLSKSKSKQKGLLIGGISKLRKDENFLSVKLINLLKTPFKRNREKDFTVFFSQKAQNPSLLGMPESALLYNKKSDTYYINCQNYKNSRWQNLLKKEDIRDNFEYISISPNDRIFIGSKQIPNNFFNKVKH